MLHFHVYSTRIEILQKQERLRGATVARLTPDQKAACSNHVGVKYTYFENYTFDNYKRTVSHLISSIHVLQHRFWQIVANSGK